MMIMNDHTEWNAESEITLELQHRLSEDRSLFVEISSENPEGGTVLEAPVVEIRNEIEVGDLKYSAPRLVGLICKLLDRDLSQIIEMGPVDVTDGLARVVVRIHRLKAKTATETNNV